MHRICKSFALPWPGDLQAVRESLLRMPQTKSARTVYATATRSALLDLLKHERRYLTAAAIYGTLRPSIPKLALSTIYRTLDLLTELGTISSRPEGSGE